MKIKQLKKIVIIHIFFFLYLGCHISRTSYNTFISQEKIGRIRRIAVAPFSNLSSRLNAEIIVAHVIMAELIETKRFDVLKFGDIQELLLNQKMPSVSTVDIETLHLIRRKLKADAVLFGTVYRYDDGKEAGRTSAPPVITVSVSLIETKLGRILWREDISELGSTKGYLLEDRERYLCVGLAKKVAERLILNFNEGC